MSVTNLEKSWAKLHPETRPANQNPGFSPVVGLRTLVSQTSQEIHQLSKDESGLAKSGYLSGPLVFILLGCGIGGMFLAAMTPISTQHPESWDAKEPIVESSQYDIYDIVRDNLNSVAEPTETPRPSFLNQIKEDFKGKQPTPDPRTPPKGAVKQGGLWVIGNNIIGRVGYGEGGQAIVLPLK